MNHIYKKVWSRVRGCFVAVSEAMTSVSQTGGKLAIVVLSAFFGSSNVCAPGQTHQKLNRRPR